MNRQAILDRLNAEAPALRTKYGVTSLAGFGPMARGDDHDDVDVLVFPIEGPAALDEFMGLKLDPEDLLAPRCLSPRMQAEIDREAVLVPWS